MADPSRWPDLGVSHSRKFCIIMRRKWCILIQRGSRRLREAIMDWLPIAFYAVIAVALVSTIWAAWVVIRR